MYQRKQDIYHPKIFTEATETFSQIEIERNGGSDWKGEWSEMVWACVEKGRWACFEKSVGV